MVDFGVAYGGLEATGGPEVLENYPFQLSSTFPQPNSCTPNACNSNGIFLESGFQKVIDQGIANCVSKPSFAGIQPHIKTPYSESYNLTAEKALTNDLVATIAYVGAVSRHLAVVLNQNQAAALIDPRLSTVTVEPFPQIGSASVTFYIGASTYNALQTRLEKRFTNGLNCLATYTWAHSLDDATHPLGGGNDSGYRNPSLIGIKNDYSNSETDVRNGVTFNGFYELPFGSGKKYLNRGGVINALLGGWSTDLMFVAQTGFPISVGTDLGGAGPNGAGSNAILVRDQFGPGGTPPPSNQGVTPRADAS